MGDIWPALSGKYPLIPMCRVVCGRLQPLRLSNRCHTNIATKRSACQEPSSRGLQAMRIALFSLMLLAAALPSKALSAQPAFPGAVGWAADIAGGRGGRIVRVTTLAAEGPGSLKAA